MPYYRRKRLRYRIWEKVRRVFWVMAGLAVLAGLWWWLAHLGPREVKPDATDEAGARRDETAEALLTEIAHLRGELKDAAGDETLGLLEAVIARQQELVSQGNAKQADLRELRDLQQQRDSLQAASLDQRVGQLAAQAEAAAAKSEWTRAEAAWTEALRLQREINRSGADTARKNFVREGELVKTLQELAASPLAEEVREARRVAVEALANENWSDALAALVVARDQQRRINAEFPRSAAADLRLLDEIEREIESLDAAGIAAEVDGNEARGDEAFAAANYATAVEAFETARQGQLRLNREFSRSRFLSSPRVEQLERKRQTASSVPLLEGIRRDVERIDRLLRRREVGAAADRISAVAAELEEVFTQLPKSEKLDADLRLKLGYLATQVDRLEGIQDKVYERLVPLPGISERRLLNTEFPQSLYLQVMRVNPSRQAGRAYPVDSVNWSEASTCCQRLSWILGRPVRLPTEDEFRIAVGDPAAHQLISLTGGVATEMTAPMAARAANEAGFFDLLGNLAEWLQPGATQSELWAKTGGGSYLDEPSTLRSVPVREVQRTERARHLGFRIVVEFDDS